MLNVPSISPSTPFLVKLYS